MKPFIVCNIVGVTTLIALYNILLWAGLQHSESMTISTFTGFILSLLGCFILKTTSTRIVDIPTLVYGSVGGAGVGGIIASSTPFVGLLFGGFVLCLFLINGHRDLPIRFHWTAGTMLLAGLTVFSAFCFESLAISASVGLIGTVLLALIGYVGRTRGIRAVA